MPHEGIVIQSFGKHIGRLVVGVDEDASNALSLDFIANAVSGEVEVLRQLRNTPLLRDFDGCRVVHSQGEWALQADIQFIQEIPDESQLFGRCGSSAVLR